MDIDKTVVSSNEIEIYSDEENSEEIYSDHSDDSDGENSEEIYSDGSDNSDDSDHSDDSDDFYEENSIRKICMYKIILRRNKKNIEWIFFIFQAWA